MMIELESRSGSRVVTFRDGLLVVENKYNGLGQAALLGKKTAEELAIAILKWANES